MSSFIKIIIDQDFVFVYIDDILPSCNSNKRGAAQVGAISKAQKQQKDFKFPSIDELRTLLRKKKFSKKVPQCRKKLKGRTLWSRPVLYVTRETFLVQFLGPPGTLWQLCKFCRTFGRTILFSSGLFWS